MQAKRIKRILCIIAAVAAPTPLHAGVLGARSARALSLLIMGAVVLGANASLRGSCLDSYFADCARLDAVLNEHIARARAHPEIYTHGEENPRAALERHISGLRKQNDKAKAAAWASYGECVKREDAERAREREAKRRAEELRREEENAKREAESKAFWARLKAEREAQQEKSDREREARAAEWKAQQEEWNAAAEKRRKNFDEFLDSVGRPPGPVSDERREMETAELRSRRLDGNIWDRGMKDVEGDFADRLDDERYRVRVPGQRGAERGTDYEGLGAIGSSADRASGWHNRSTPSPELQRYFRAPEELRSRSKGRPSVSVESSGDPSPERLSPSDLTGLGKAAAGAYVEAKSSGEADVPSIREGLSEKAVEALSPLGPADVAAAAVKRQATELQKLYNLAPPTREPSGATGLIDRFVDLLPDSPAKSNVGGLTNLRDEGVGLIDSIGMAVDKLMGTDDPSKRPFQNQGTR